jgi:hypothetical protein
MLLYARRGILNPSDRRAGSNKRLITLWLSRFFLPTITTTMKIAQLVVSLDLAIITCAQMTDRRIRDWFTGQIKQQKLSPIRFSGKHNDFDPHTLTTQEILDFDFEAECSEFIDLRMLEIKRLNDVDRITIISGESHEEAGEEELMQQAFEKLQDIATSGDRSVLFYSQNTSYKSDSVQHHI